MSVVLVANTNGRLAIPALAGHLVLLQCHSLESAKMDVSVGPTQCSDLLTVLLFCAPCCTAYEDWLTAWLMNTMLCYVFLIYRSIMFQLYYVYDHVVCWSSHLKRSAFTDLQSQLMLWVVLSLLTSGLSGPNSNARVINFFGQIHHMLCLYTNLSLFHHTMVDKNEKYRKTNLTNDRKTQIREHTWHIHRCTNLL